jgi:hypothetical protein
MKPFHCQNAKMCPRFFLFSSCMFTTFNCTLLTQSLYLRINLCSTHNARILYQSSKKDYIYPLNITMAIISNTNRLCLHFFFPSELWDIFICHLSLFFKEKQKQKGICFRIFFLPTYLIKLVYLFFTCLEIKKLYYLITESYVWS